MNRSSLCVDLPSSLYSTAMCTSVTLSKEFRILYFSDPPKLKCSTVLFCILQILKDRYLQKCFGCTYLFILKTVLRVRKYWGDMKSDDLNGKDFSQIIYCVMRKLRVLSMCIHIAVVGCIFYNTVLPVHPFLNCCTLSEKESKYLYLYLNLYLVLVIFSDM